MLYRIALIGAFSLSACSLLIAAACKDGGDDGQANPSSSAAPETLEEQLASILLKDEEVPQELEAGALEYSTNEQVAGPSQEELDRLNGLGRQLGVDLTFVPVADVPADSPARGGIQNSASVYLDPEGASQAFKTRSEAARTNDWPANYQDLDDVQTAEVASGVGDESYWLRITGLDQCEAAEATPGPSPAPTCPPPRLAVIDHLLFRSGRTFIYLMVVSDTPTGVEDDVFAAQVRDWAMTVGGRAVQTFPPAQG